MGPINASYLIKNYSKNVLILKPVPASLRTPATILVRKFAAVIEYSRTTCLP